MSAQEPILDTSAMGDRLGWHGGKARTFNPHVSEFPEELDEEFPEAADDAPHDDDEEDLGDGLEEDGEEELLSQPDLAIASDDEFICWDPPPSARARVMPASSASPTSSLPPPPLLAASALCQTRVMPAAFVASSQASSRASSETLDKVRRRHRCKSYDASGSAQATVEDCDFIADVEGHYWNLSETFPPTLDEPEQCWGAIDCAQKLCDFYIGCFEVDLDYKIQDWD